MALRMTARVYVPTAEENFVDPIVVNDEVKAGE